MRYLIYLCLSTVSVCIRQSVFPGLLAGLAGSQCLFSWELSLNWVQCSPNQSRWPAGETFDVSRPLFPMRIASYRTFRYFQILSDTYRYLQILTDTYGILRIPTDTYRYLQILTDTYRYLQSFRPPSHTQPNAEVIWTFWNVVIEILKRRI